MNQKKPDRYLFFIPASLKIEKILREIGVSGEMNWRNGNIEQCSVPAHSAPLIIPKLTTIFPSLRTSCFTGVDENGNAVCGMTKKGYPSYGDEWQDD